MGYKGIGAKLNIDNKDLVAEIVKSKARGELTPKAVNYFIKLANHAVRRLPYSDPRDREDCIQSALLDLLKYWKNFDPKKSDNAFAYFTQFAKNGYAKQFKSIHRNNAIKRSVVFKSDKIEPATRKFLLTYTKKCIDDDRFDNKLILISYRCSPDCKKWSKWIIIDPDDFDIADTAIYEKMKNACLQIKVEYNESVETLSLDYGGDSEIYTI